MQLITRAAAILAIAAASLGSQGPPPTARDTAHVKPAFSVFDSLNAEANRRNGPRKTRVNFWADSGRKLDKALIAAPPPPPNSAPVAVFVITTGAGKCIVNQVCTFDGSGSRDDKGVTGYTWDCGAFPNCNSTGATASIAYPHVGDRTVTLTVRDAEGLTNMITRQIAVDSLIQPPLPDSQPPVPDSLPPIDTTVKWTPAALPLSVPDASPKPCTRHTDVAIPMDLQLAINAAALGDCLDLAPGQEWKGNFILPPRTCAAGAGWTTIQTKGIPDAPGTRIQPAQAQTFAKITQANNQYAIRAGQPTCNWQLLHLNVARDPAATVLVYHLMLLGASASEGQTSLAKAPMDIIVRRSWIHGDPNGELVRCIAANGIRIAMVDNWIDDCHASGFDSQAIEGWNGPGPFLIQNNFLAGAGENVMFGGAGPADSTMRPCDITMRGNHVYKRPEWKGRWSIKNIFELKNACRLLAEGNVFENSWVASQIGFAIVFKSSTGGTADTVRQGSTDLTFINNRVNNSNLGLNIQAQDCTAQACIVYRVARVRIQNNLLTNIGTSNGIVGSGWLNPVYSAPNNILVANNTFISNTPGKGFSTYLSGGAQADWDNIRWINNIFAGNTEYTMAADCAQPLHQAALDCMIGTGGKWTFSGNVVSGVLTTYQPKNPPGNTYKITQAEIGLQPDGSAPSFPGKGANVSTITQKTAGVVIDPNAAAVMGPRPQFRPRARHFTPTRADSLYMATQPRG